MANREHAFLVYKSALMYRRRFREVHSPEGMVVKPAFRPFSLATIEHLLDCTSLTLDELVRRLAAPEYWICNGKKAETPHSALSLALGSSKKTTDDGMQGLSSVSKHKNHLPPLQGTIKQVAWATKIREKHAIKNSESPYLETELAASWWIENRDTT